MEKIKAGIIGTGNISGIYFENGNRFDALQVVACADLDVDRAKARGEEFGVRGCSVEELLADPRNSNDYQFDHSASPCFRLSAGA
jgi:predicted dehydrogenase